MMARFRLTEPHFDGTRYYEKDAVVEWTGTPSTKMEAVDDEGKAKLDHFNRNRPRQRPSRDLPMHAVYDPMTRQPGQPRVAGPPNQNPVPSSDPNNPIRAQEIVAERRQAQAVNEIPSNWRDLRPEVVVNLARRNGASGKANFADAKAHLENLLGETEPAGKPVDLDKGDNAVVAAQEVRQAEQKRTEQAEMDEHADAEAGQAKQGRDAARAEQQAEADKDAQAREAMRDKKR